MACNDSNAAVDAHTPLTVVVSQGTSDLDWAHFNVRYPSNNNAIPSTYPVTRQINGIFPFNNLPNELQNKIIGHAMTATDREIMFPCLTNAGFTPNVSVGLLLVNHCIYHEAHYQLRKQNTFIFSNFGSDLKTIASSVGPLKCRSGACGHAPLRSSLTKVAFYLGDEELPGDGHGKVYAFGCALRYLRPEIIIGSLHISFAIAGDERFLKMGFEDLPHKLGMNTMPVYSLSQAYNPDNESSPCWFLLRYVPVGKQTKAQDKESIVDSTLSEAGKAFAAQLSGWLGYI